MKTTLATLALISASAPLCNALAEDASASKGLPAKLAAMPDNCWLKLDPEGTTQARMYSGACFGGGYLWYFGGAHRSWPGNNVDLFEVRANRWIRATEIEAPERDSEPWKLLTSGGGDSRRLSPRGRPFTEHTYQQVCWQPDRKRFFVVLVSTGTWEFDPQKRQWSHLVNALEHPDAQPRGYWAQNHVVWEPGLAAPVLIVTAGSPRPGSFRFDHGSNKWVRLADLVEVLKWQEFYTAYVPAWKRHLISTAKKGFFQYDAARGEVQPVEAPEELAGCQSLSYDTAAGVVIALERKRIAKYRQTVVPWALDVGTMKWTRLAPPEPWPAGQSTGAWACLWYDAEHNVHLMVNDLRRDRRETFDGGVTETWAYRYKRSGGEATRD